MIDFREVIKHLKISDLTEGDFDIDVNLPGGRSVNLKGRLTVHGRQVHNYADPLNDGYFVGGVEFSLYDWTGYDAEGNEVNIINSTWFENRIQTLLNL